MDLHKLTKLQNVTHMGHMHTCSRNDAFHLKKLCVIHLSDSEKEAIKSIFVALGHGSGLSDNLAAR